MCSSRVVVVVLLLLAGGCSSAPLSYRNATPQSPRSVPAWLYRPPGSGPFPAVVLMHGCHGVSPATHRWGRWLAEVGYVALVADSWTARGIREDCSPRSPDLPPRERWDDAIGALRFLQAQPDVDAERVGAIGWSSGGAFAISVVNGPSLERQEARGVLEPSPGFKAAVGFYPGSCASFVRERVIRPLLVLIGDADDWTLPGPCAEMVAAMRSLGAPAEIVIYPGAVHYFDVEGLPRTLLADVTNRNKPNDCCGATVGFDAAATADAHRRVAEFFGRHLAAH